MSAGKNAIPLSEENPEWLKTDIPDFKCDCGYIGKGHELLVEEDNDTMYCPMCTTAAWIWR